MSCRSRYGGGGGGLRTSRGEEGLGRSVGWRSSCFRKPPDQVTILQLAVCSCHFVWVTPFVVFRAIIM